MFILKFFRFKYSALSRMPIISLLFFIPVVLFAWTPPVNISNTEGKSKYPAMCQDKRGWLHVVFEDDTHGDDDIYYTFYDGTAWSDTLNVSDDATTSWRPDVTADTLNRIHVVWGDYDTGKIMWTMKDNFGWSNPTSISDSTPFSVAPEVDVSPVTNYVHCVWHDLGTSYRECEIWHNIYNGGLWDKPSIISGDTNRSIWPDVCLDSINRIHVVWQNVINPDSAVINYSRFDSVSWSIPNNISKLEGNSTNPRITLDKYCNPRVVWEKGNSSYYTYFNGNEWINPLMLDGYISNVPNISADIQSRSHIVWTHINNVNDIYYQIFIDTIPVNPPENVTNNQGDTLASRALISVDSEYVHLVWSQSLGGTSPSANWELYYSKELLSGIMNNGKEASFNLPNISYRKISFSYFLRSTTHVEITFYDITGRKVKEKELGCKNKGNYQCNLSFNVNSGIYFCILNVGNQKYRGKFIFINH